MATQFLGTRYQSFKDDGTVNAGGSVYFYETGTSTAKTTYSDSALSPASANANPVVLNSAGAADIWYDGDADVTVKDSTGTTIDSYTSINPATSDASREANLITNGSFEDGSSTVPVAWTRSAPPSGGTSAQDTDSAHGLYSWKFTSTGSGAGSLISEDFINVSELLPITITWLMKSSVADVRNLVEMVWYDDADAELSAASLYDDSSTNPTSWTEKIAVVTPASTAVRAKLRLTGCHSSDATPGSTWFDGVRVSAKGLYGPIAFSATQITSSDANTLDDYEEGTWTPVLTFATPGDLSVTYSSQAGYYTKIGRFVHAYFVIVTSSFTHTTASSYLTISGFPLTIVTGVGRGSLEFRGITKANYTNFVVQPGLTSTSFGVAASASAQNNSQVVAADMPTGGTVYLYGSIAFSIY